MSDSIAMPDKGLQKAIIETMQKNRCGKFISPKYMASLYLLDARGRDISNLAGIEYAKTISRLFLGNNAIEDISQLSGLTNLITLCLKNNSITDVSPLSGMKKLEYLNLGGNEVTDLSPIAGLLKGVDPHPEHPMTFVSGYYAYR